MAGMEEESKNTPILQISGMNKRYGDRVIFDNFSLTVNAGEMICICGASGSGKSTLLNIIGMFEKADSGEVRLFGEKIPDVNSKAGRKLLKNRLFYLFQNFALVQDETIDRNLEISMLESGIPRKERQKRKLAALKKVGLGYLSPDEKIYHLSGGEQQRVAIARGYLKPFDLLLADEPTGSLDEGNRDGILSILDSFHASGKTVIIVSHDPVVAAHCGKTVRIGDNA